MVPTRKHLQDRKAKLAQLDQASQAVMRRIRKDARELARLRQEIETLHAPARPSPVDPI